MLKLLMQLRWIIFRYNTASSNLSCNGVTFLGASVVEDEELQHRKQ